MINILVFFLFFISCGVKTPPVAPEGTRLPSILEELDQELESKKKNSNAK